MSDFQPEAIVTRLFNRIRQEFNLGLREYLAALDAVRGGYGADQPEDLHLVLQALWCHSLQEQHQFTLIWEQTLLVHSPKAPPKPERESKPPNRPQQPPETPPPPSLPSEPPVPQPEEQSGFKPLPVQSPPLPTDSDNTSELNLYFPVSRRSMSYLWRYLRRPVADGPEEVLDIRETVKRVTRQGFFLAPVCRRREGNRAILLLLVY